MDDKKKKAIEALKEAMRQTKAQIDPAVLAVAQKALSAKQKKMAAGKDTDVPYDKKSAAAAIALFLKDSPEAQKKILAMLEQGKN
jgi:hypothetical protein